jgi:hypothetical protein
MEDLEMKSLSDEFSEDPVCFQHCYIPICNSSVPFCFKMPLTRVITKLCDLNALDTPHFSGARGRKPVVVSRLNTGGIGAIKMHSPTQMIDEATKSQ